MAERGRPASDRAQLRFPRRPGPGQAQPILLVEDDEVLRRVLARHLRGQGYEVVETTSAEGTVETLASGLRPALVLLDLNLPGDTGWDLLRGPQLAEAGSPPVVVTSATTVNPRQLHEFHVAGYLPKPFALETLVATVERLLHPPQDAQEPT